MGTKTNPGKFDCHAKAEADEPVFTLIGRDPSAGFMVRAWANHREYMIYRGMLKDTPQEREKIAEARLCAARMDEFYERRNGRSPNPGPGDWGGERP